MNENHRLIKDVSNALNFYMERTRREEGFDLSGVLRPGYDLNQFKFNKLFGYSTGYDTTMKKILMPQLSLPKAFRPESEEIKLREKFYKDELKYHLRFDRNNRKNQRPKSQGAIRSKSVNEFVTYNKNGEKKSKPKVPAGVLTIRSTHTPALTKREKLSMVNITSKIMSASSELCFQKEDILLMKSLADAKGNNTCYVKKTLSQSRRDEQEEYERRLLNRHKEYERQNLLRNLKNDEIKELENDAKNQEEDDVFESSDNDNKKLASSSITPINETSHNRDNNESRLRDRRTEKLNQIKNAKEVTDGELIKYRIVIKTGERLGSSTEAKIKLKLFGSKGKSKQFKLKDSKMHKIPFRKGNTDVFDLEVFDLGDIKAVYIGHKEQNIEYSWFIDYIGVEDQNRNICYTFEPSDWFSSTSGDGHTARILLKKNSTSLDSDASNSTDGMSSRSSSSMSTVRSNHKSLSKTSNRSNNIYIKEKLNSSSSSTLHRSSTPRSERDDLNKSEKTNENISMRSERKQSTSMSVREAENEIQSQKFEFSPAQSRAESRSIQIAETNINMNIFEAAEMNRIDILKSKLQMSPLDITQTDLSGKSLLILACEKGHVGIVKYLVDNSDDLLNIDTCQGLFPAHVCAENNNLECMDILYDFGASIQPKTNDGDTPLHLAAENGHMDAVVWLVDHNVNVSFLNFKAEMAYDIAKKRGFIDIANYLAEPSGIKNILTEQIGESPFARPKGPSPHNERSSSSKSTSSTKRILIVRKSSRSSSSSSSRSTSRNSARSSSSKNRKADSSSHRIQGLDVKSLISKVESNRSRSVSKASSRNRSKSNSSTASESLKSNRQSSSLMSSSSVSLRRIQNSRNKNKKVANRSTYSSYTDSNSDSSLTSKKSSKSKKSNISSKSSLSSVASKPKVVVKKTYSSTDTSDTDNEKKKNIKAKSNNSSFASHR